MSSSAIVNVICSEFPTCPGKCSGILCSISCLISEFPTSLGECSGILCRILCLISEFPTCPGECSGILCRISCLISEFPTCPGECSRILCSILCLISFLLSACVLSLINVTLLLLFYWQVIDDSTLLNALFLLEEAALM